MRQQEFCIKTACRLYLGVLWGGLVGSGLLAVEDAGAGIDVWTSNGPEGGFVRALVVDPSSPQTIYAGTYGGGVFSFTWETPSCAHTYDLPDRWRWSGTRRHRRGSNNAAAGHVFCQTAPMNYLTTSEDDPSGSRTAEGRRVG